MWLFITAAYIGTLGFAGFVLWLQGARAAQMADFTSQITELREKVAKLSQRGLG